MENFEVVELLGEGSYGQERLFDCKRAIFTLELISRQINSQNKASLVKRKYDQKLFVIKEVKIRGMTDEEKNKAMKEVENLKKLRNLTRHIVE